MPFGVESYASVPNRVNRIWDRSFTDATRYAHTAQCTSGVKRSSVKSNRNT